MRYTTGVPLLGMFLAACLAAATAQAETATATLAPTAGNTTTGTVTFTQKGEKVEARFPDAKEPVSGTLKDGKLSLAGRLYSSEAGAEADFHLDGTLAGQELKGKGPQFVGKVKGALGDDI